MVGTTKASQRSCYRVQVKLSTSVSSFYTDLMNPVGHRFIYLLAGNFVHFVLNSGYMSPVINSLNGED